MRLTIIENGSQLDGEAWKEVTDMIAQSDQQAGIEKLRTLLDDPETLTGIEQFVSKLPELNATMELVTGFLSSSSRMADNANGIVEVEAMDLVTGQILPHRMASGQVSLEDLAHNRAPMQVALVMDCSGSMYGRNLDAARAAASSNIAD